MNNYNKHKQGKYNIIKVIIYFLRLKDDDE